MFVSRDLVSGSVIPIRRMRIGATVIAGQVVVKDSAGPGEITDPTDVNTFVDQIGVTYEAGTYATTSPHVFVKTSYSPFAVLRGRLSGGTTNDAAHTTVALITQAGVANMTTVVAATSVATMDYIMGYLIGLTGVNAGHIRVITGQSDNTSCTVTVALPASSVIGDTFLRVHAPFVEGVETTATFDQFNNLIEAGEALNTAATGEFCVIDTIFEGQSCHGTNQVNVTNASNPVVEIECVMLDHAFNPFA